MHPYVHCSIMYNSQAIEAAQVPKDKWIKMLCYIYTMEYYSAIKIEWILTICVDEPREYYAQSEKEQCHVISLICGI